MHLTLKRIFRIQTVVGQASALRRGWPLGLKTPEATKCYREVGSERNVKIGLRVPKTKNCASCVLLGHSVFVATGK